MKRVYTLYSGSGLKEREKRNNSQFYCSKMHCLKHQIMNKHYNTTNKNMRENVSEHKVSLDHISVVTLVSDFTANTEVKPPLGSAFKSHA